MAKTETPSRDAVLIKYLNEAYGKEKQLEQNLQLLVKRASDYKTLKKGFQEHLKVTKNQAKGLEKRIKALGGKAETGPDLPGPDALTNAGSAVANVANRAVAMAKGPVQMLRGTGEADNMLRNVRDAFWNEAEEIAHYNVIEQVAEKLNDSETVKLAKQFRREEEKMQKLLEREIKKLVGAVVKDEVPAAERRTSTGTKSRRRSSSSSRSSSATRSSSSTRSTGSSRSSGATRKSASSSGTARKSASSSRSSGSSSSSRSRSAASRSGGSSSSRRTAAASSARRSSGSSGSSSSS